MTKTAIAIWAVLFLAVLAAAFFWVNRPRKIIIGAALPLSFPQQGFSHGSFENLLQSYVSADGRIDYDRWHQSSTATQQLESYLAAVSEFSPKATPERFPNRNDELAYWMYGYNAYVIRSVLDHWPLESVTDVKAPVEAVKGLGFFYQQRFSFGGEFMSLLDAENKEIRKKYQDPRIHFFLKEFTSSSTAQVKAVLSQDRAFRSVRISIGSWRKRPLTLLMILRTLSSITTTRSSTYRQFLNGMKMIL